jgi:hypothetical protein
MPYESGRYSVTELTLAMSHSPPQWRGWASPRELAEQCRGMIPRRAVAWLCGLTALNARTRPGAGALVREPRAGRSPLEGGVNPRARRSPLEGA